MSLVPLRKEYRRKWVEEGYGTEMGSAEVVPPPPGDFIRVYHLTTAEHALSNIVNGRIKVARFSDLNDAFELTAVSFRDRKVREIVQRFRKEQDRRTGLLCFSEDWTSPLLWGHYGDRHRGICLGFDLQRDDAQGVKYEGERIPKYLADLGNPPKLEDELKSVLLRTKFMHWDYEQEQRFIVPLIEAEKIEDLHFWPLNRNLRLAEVILGSRCSAPLEIVRAKTRDQDQSIVVFRARPAFKFFKLTPDGRTVL